MIYKIYTWLYSTNIIACLELPVEMVYGVAKITILLLHESDETLIGPPPGSVFGYHVAGLGHFTLIMFRVFMCVCALALTKFCECFRSLWFSLLCCISVQPEQT